MKLHFVKEHLAKQHGAFQVTAVSNGHFDIVRDSTHTHLGDDQRAGLSPHGLRTRTEPIVSSPKASASPASMEQRLAPVSILALMRTHQRCS